MHKHFYALSAFGLALAAGVCLVKMPLPVGLLTSLSLGISFRCVLTMREIDIAETLAARETDR